MSKVQAQKLFDIALSKIKPEDITHRGFLKPIEIALKTYKTQRSNENCRLQPGSLPGGLKIAVKAGRDSEKRMLQDVEEITQNQSFMDLVSKKQDNMLALMKRSKGIKIAICVCMYSEDKKMLKSTMAGISENIANIVAFEKVDPDDIGVFVMMDGIEKVDKSIIDYFQEQEKSNHINLGDNIVPSLSVADMMRRAETMTQEEINEQEMKNVNNFLFDAAELDERNSIRFQSVEKSYSQIKKLLKQIKVLQKDKPLYEDLPARLQSFFIDEARSQRKVDYAETDQDVKHYTDQLLLKEYASDVNKMRLLIVKTLHAGQQFCKSYIRTRQDLSHLSYFRKKVFYEPQHLPENYQASRSGTYHRNQQGHLIEQSQTEPFTIMNLFLCVKYKNAGKLSSHNWFFNGFCKELKPEYAILLDVGLRPDPEALLKMYRYMKNNDTIGGVCGYMSLKIQKLDREQEINDDDVDCLTSLMTKITDIQRTQQVEYHFAHLMDKPFEASFGFIHVLPGAFSAYNMKAILDYNSEGDDILLRSYFKSIDQKLANRKVVKSQMGVSNAILRTILPDFINSCCITIDPESDEAMLYDQNVYLAEDRILCMGIHKKNYDMAFLPDAYAEVDPIKTVHGLLGQRKRWINGSYFAFEKVKRELTQHEKKNGYEFCLNMQIFYLSFMNALSYFSPSFFLFTVHIAMDAFRQDVLTKVLAGTVNDTNNSSQFYNAFVFTMDFIYVLLLMTIIFYSLHLTNNNKKFKTYIYGVSTLFGLFMITIFAVLTVDIIRGFTGTASFLVLNQAAIQSIAGAPGIIEVLRWMLIGSLAIYIVPIGFYVLLFGNGHILCEIFMGAFSFLFYTPTYLNILNIYSLCRIDDISWGTKGLDSGSDKNANLKDSWRLIKFVHVVKYVIWNIILASVLLTLGSSYAHRFWVTFGMVILIGLSMVVKVLVGVLYMLKYKIKSCSYGGNKPQPNTNSQIRSTIEKYESEIKEDIIDKLNGLKEGYIANNGGSFIQVGRNQKEVLKAIINMEKMSSIQRRGIITSTLSKSPLFSIPEEREKSPNRPMPNKQRFRNQPKLEVSKQHQTPKKVEGASQQSIGEHQRSTDNLNFVPKPNPKTNLAPIYPVPKEIVVNESEFERSSGAEKSKYRVNPPPSARQEDPLVKREDSVDKNKFKRK